jgi:hypothetical protein
MAAVNRVKLPPNVRLRQHESHLLAAAAAAWEHGSNASAGSSLPAAVLSSSAMNGSIKDVDVTQATTGNIASVQTLMRHVRGALHTTGGCRMIFACCVELALCEQRQRNAAEAATVTMACM